jgi:TolA-binding protein
MKRAVIVVVSVVAGVAVGMVASAAGTATAMKALTDTRDEQRDRMAKGLQSVIDTAAADLAAMSQRVKELEAELEAKQPKVVKRAD